MIARLLATAERHPDRPAIEPADGPAITYRDLFAGAARHADTLAAAGVGRNALVTIEASRTVSFVQSVLGTWLVGAAFLPIDPATPTARRAVMMERVRGVDDLAYVIFTSGSGGEPRGVMVGHRGLPALIDAQIDAFGLEPASRALWLHAPIFDASISDIGTALASGATLVIGDDPAVRSASGLRVTLEGRAISHVDLPTALLRFLDADRLPPALRTVILGGEACPVDQVRRLAERVRVVVVYGPTEATVCSSLTVVDPATWTRPLIGAPLPGVRYRVVEDELWIGGDGLALGYAGDPAQTAARFVMSDGERWYRTGDRVEALDGGALAFCGRTDRQVKLAGRRIELDEIEAVLRGSSGVTDAAVCVRPLDPAQPTAPPRLVGFVVGDATGITEALATQLPAWMIPAIVEPVEQLPRTATGKVDHRALASWPLCGAAAGKQAGTDPISRELAPLWCAALGVPSVGPDDRFAAHGGDSLATLALVAAAEARALPLAPHHLDGDPTFAEVAARLRAAADPPPVTAAELEARIPAIQPSRNAQWPAPRDRAGTVLFTGATGFLGARLLTAWRARDTRPIVCLVRARDHAAARRRLDADDDVAVVLGDLALPRLGLDELSWRRLSNEVTTVVHAGGLVHLGLGWDALAPTNLGAAVEIARLIATGRPKAWHHVSSLGVFASTDRSAGRHAEREHADDEAVVYGAYAQTKLAAERVASNLHGSASPLTIHRLGLLTGDAATGEAPAREQLGMTLRGLARLGAVPVTAIALRVDITPVDHAAAAVAALSLRAEELAIDELHHVASTTGATLDQLAGALRAEGVALEEIPAPAWADRARARFADPDVAVAYLSLMRAHAADRARLRPFDLFLATGADFAVERTDAILSTLGVVPPAIDDALLRRLVAAALRDGAAP